MATNEQSTLGPIHPSQIKAEANEDEKKSNVLKREIVDSLSGRIVRSTYQTIKATGTSMICLSPWGDSSPLVLPNIRWRDFAVESVMLATGGTAAIAAPVIPTDFAASAAGTIVTEVADWVVFDTTADKLAQSHDSRTLTTTGTKELCITLKHKITPHDAQIGFYRSGLHADKSLMCSVKEYLGVEKGWFSPYLFASNRRPVIPRTMQPDVVFCHGPFLAGDYQVGETLLKESAQILLFTKEPVHSATTSAAQIDEVDAGGITTVQDNKGGRDEKSSRLSQIKGVKTKLSSMVGKGKGQDKGSEQQPEGPQHSADTEATAPSTPPRRMVILPLGIKPFRKGIWTSSIRPEESIIRYIVMNGCPSIVVPVKRESPLLSWDASTFSQLWKLNVPKDHDSGSTESTEKLEKQLGVLSDYVDLCVDWNRVESTDRASKSEAEKKDAVREALKALLLSAVRSGDSDDLRKKFDGDRAGIAMWRIP